ncbi:flavodoxin domain-containing protein [Nocardia sp. NPDC050710]|uniref:flavodoxin family protein n=1 Tax=Nocardia sp. NPDC050710 TaxID=3157220 RepID=UPI0033DE7FE7
MRAQVVYESMFGNTEAIAEAIAEGLGTHCTVELLKVAAAAEQPAPPVDLLVVGGPTHVFGLSRTRTRRDAADRTQAPVAVDVGIREWLDHASPVPPGTRAVAFGTKAATPTWLPGSAARGAAKRLRHLGYELADSPVDFFVGGMLGPLVAGEVECARTWADRLSRTELDRITYHGSTPREQP